MNSQRTKVVFLVGAGRSGSTLLELILDGHSQIRGLGELNHLTGILDRSPPANERFCSLCGDDCDLWNRTYDVSVISRYFSSGGILSGPRRSFLRRFKSIYAYFAAWGPEPILVDSSKNARWIRRALRPSYVWRKMKPVIVYLVRDGRAVVSARLRTHSNMTIEQVTLDWLTRIRESNRLFHEFPAASSYQLAYEHLAAEPEVAVRDLVRFLGVEYEPSMLKYWEYPHHIVGGNQWLINSYIRHCTEGDEATSGEGRNVWEGAGSVEWHAKTGPGIRLDERWRNELVGEQLAVFEQIAGKDNRSSGYSD